MNKQQLLNMAHRIMQDAENVYDPDAIHAYVARANAYINLANSLDGVVRRVGVR